MELKFQETKSNDYLVQMKIENNYQKFGSFVVTDLKVTYQKVNFMCLWH
jgi:hypothetical protein